METNFTKAINDFNETINKSEFGSESYQLLCELKYKFIKYYKVC